MTSTRLPSEDRPPVSDRVVETVADAKGISPADIPTPLFEAVDPDALDSLFRSRRTPNRVSFDFSGCEVTVTGDGGVDVHTLGGDGTVADGN